jgi:hypothetical protein
MPKLSSQLELESCPHCGVNTPNVSLDLNFETWDANKTRKRHWGVYSCRRCGGVITASAPRIEQEIEQYFPKSHSVDESIPSRAKSYLSQAYQSLHVPSGAVMLAASAVDAMLKEEGLTEGSLYARIDKAANEGVITQDMAVWAHEIRLDANEQRHADQESELPTTLDAERVIEFASALAQFMFVLPARVSRGLGQEPV